jgi:hypothetical protein
MAQSRRADLRLPRIIHAYLDELAKLGVYGRGRSGVMRRFIEQGIQTALEARVIAPKNADDFIGAGDEPVAIEEEEEE